VTGGGPVSLTFSARCGNVEGQGWACMVDDTAGGGPEADMAVGHVTVVGGPHDGRCLAVVCARHASEAGYGEFKARLVEWMVNGLLAHDLGPGPGGAPQVLHREPGGEWHRDPLPEHRHERQVIP
jgi:hypothetical protein